MNYFKQLFSQIFLELFLQRCWFSRFENGSWIHVQRGGQHNSESTWFNFKSCRTTQSSRAGWNGESAIFVRWIQTRRVNEATQETAFYTRFFGTASQTCFENQRWLIWWQTKVYKSMNFCTNYYYMIWFLRVRLCKLQSCYLGINENRVFPFAPGYPSSYLMFPNLTNQFILI